MNTRFINCQVCQTEGRLLTNDGGPDDVDHGVCPACNGERSVEVETQPIELEDLDYECENCIGMIEHGCYCKAMGAIAPGVPGHELCRSCGRLFKFGETCTRGGCPCGGDV